MWQFIQALRDSFVKALEHDQFAVAKAAAYSAIFTLFPAALLLASFLVMLLTNLLQARQQRYLDAT